jgi:hypothetical protein
MPGRAAFLILAVALASCSGLQGGRGAITDADIDSLALKRSALTTTPTTGVGGEAQAFHLKIEFGLLAEEDRGAQSHEVVWDGAAAVSDGTATAEAQRDTEPGDEFVASDLASMVKWSSKTRPHFDTYVMKISPATATETVVVALPQLTRTLDVAALAAGYEERTAVDSVGHEVAISAVPDQACAGFAYGFLTVGDDGISFGGLVTGPSGDTVGRLRFSGVGALQGELTSTAEGLLATAAGSYDAAAGTFTLALTAGDGSAYGTIAGLYAPPSYSSRGSFAGHLLCP